MKAFVAAPREAQFNIIGIVRFGMEFGLLAMTEAGNYLRINGSTTQRLNNREVAAAIDKARLCTRGESYATSRSADRAAPSPLAPTVWTKRHRRIDPDLAANNSQLQPLAA